MSKHSPIVNLENVSLRYGGGREILSRINLTLEPGSFHFLTGASGSGKSTLIRLLYLGQRSFNGKVEILGQDISKLSTDEAATLRQKIGVVFQDFHLLEHLNVIDNIALPLRVRGMNQKKSRVVAEQILDWVGLHGFADVKPDTLSGGEQQRVALARAVIGKPRLLLADEPTGSVDDAIAIKLLHLFEQLHASGTTIVLATHNRDLTGEFPHREICVENAGLRVLEPMQQERVYKDAS
jgi:cell division transport system ATP-binding protein